MKFISIDPSLRNTALVYGVIEGDKLVPQGYELITTEKGESGEDYVVQDLIKRCVTINTGVKGLLKTHDPQVIFTEIPSGSQNYYAAIGMAACCYLIATLYPIPILVDPKQLKLLTIGKDTASKKEIIEYVRTKYPNFALPMKMQKGKESVVVGKAEHICDAVCAAEAGMQTNQYKQIKNFVKR